MPAYYNEIDPYAAQWLRNLIAAGHIAPGDVDERSIEDVRPDDLIPYVQCHFFAGIEVWSHALRRAGWDDNLPVWTGSCPCQSFSAAGKGAGFADERHLWPAWFHLIRVCRPGVVFGEQVEAAVNHGWLDLVQSDLERENYAVGAVGFPACGVGAPHIRQRLWFVAERMANPELHEQRYGRGPGSENPTRDESGTEPCGRSAARRLLNAVNAGLEGFAGHVNNGDQPGRLGADEARPVGQTGKPSGMDDTQSARRGVCNPEDERTANAQGNPLADASDSTIDGQQRPSPGGPGPTNGFWRDADWLYCRDGKWRPVEPGTFPLAHGSPARVGRLRAYGNAINAEAAEAMILSYQDCRP